MKVIRLAQATIIDGIPRAKGEHVMVPDGYDDPDLVSRVVAEGVEKTNAARVHQAEKREEVRVTVNEIKYLVASLVSLDAAKKEAELEKDPKTKEEKLKQIAVEQKAAEDRKRELEEKIGIVSEEPVEEPKEEPVEEPVSEEPKKGKN